MQGIKKFVLYLDKTEIYDMHKLFICLHSRCPKKIKKELTKASEILIHQLNMTRYSHVEVRKLIVDILGFGFPAYNTVSSWSRKSHVYHEVLNLKLQLVF